MPAKRQRTAEGPVSLAPAAPSAADGARENAATAVATPAPSTPSVSVSPTHTPSPRLRVRKASRRSLLTPTNLSSPHPLDVSYHKYAVDGAYLTDLFEPGQPAYLVFVTQKGNQSQPSVTYQLQKNLEEWVQALASSASNEERDREEVATSVNDLAPLTLNSVNLPFIL